MNCQRHEEHPATHRVAWQSAVMKTPAYWYLCEEEAKRAVANFTARNVSFVVEPIRACAQSTHERMKRDPVLFLGCTFRGFITFNGVPLVMVRNCVRCKASLGLRMATVAEMYPLPGVEVAELIKEYVQ